MHVSSNMELKGKPVQVRYDPVTVIVGFQLNATGRYFSGKVLKMGKLKSGDLLISGKRDSCGRREILIKSYNFMCCIYMFDSLMVRFRDGCGSICLFFRSKSQEWTV